MKVILTDKVSTLGNVGEIVNVSPGYARNFLIPNRKAVVADEGNAKQMAHYQKSLAKKVDAEKQEAEATKSKLDGKSISFIKRVGGNGKLFGSVTNLEIASKLAEEGIEVERRVLTSDRPIKSLGSYTVKAKLFQGVVSEFNVKVEIDPAQAEEMKKKQEELAKMKKAQQEAAAAAKEAGEETGEGKEDKPEELTEEQRLAKEADALLRN